MPKNNGKAEGNSVVSFPPASTPGEEAEQASGGTHAVSQQTRASKFAGIIRPQCSSKDIVSAQAVRIPQTRGNGWRSLYGWGVAKVVSGA